MEITRKLGNMIKNKLNKRNKKSGRIEIINKTEKQLTDKEKNIIINVLEDAKKRVEELKTIVIEEEEDRRKIINIILEIQELIDIEDENTGKQYTIKDYNKMTQSELIDLTSEALEYALKQFKNKEG